MRITAVALSLVVLLAGAVFAWSPINTVVSVPFDFYANNTLMPAGNYSIDTSNVNRGGVLTITGRVRGHRVMIPTSPGRGGTVDRSQLVFRVYGDSYFLAEVHDEFRGTIRRAPESRQEKEMSRGGARSDEVALAVR